MKTAPICRVLLIVGTLVTLSAVPAIPDEPASLPKALIDGTGLGWRALGEADFVNGSRRLGANSQTDSVRRAGVVVFGSLLSRLTGVRITDPSNGLRVWRTEVTDTVALRQTQYQTSELLIRTIAHGFIYSCLELLRGRLVDHRAHVVGLVHRVAMLPGFGLLHHHLDESVVQILPESRGP